jgi:hypothetical protein
MASFVQKKRTKAAIFTAPLSKALGNNQEFDNVSKYM